MTKGNFPLKLIFWVSLYIETPEKQYICNNIYWQFFFTKGELFPYDGDVNQSWNVAGYLMQVKGLATPLMRRSKHKWESFVVLFSNAESYSANMHNRKREFLAEDWYHVCIFQYRIGLMFVYFQSFIKLACKILNFFNSLQCLTLLPKLPT